MSWKRLSFVSVLVLPSLLLACGTGEVNVDDPTQLQGDGGEDDTVVPPTDEELSTGEEGDEVVGQDVLDEGTKNAAGFTNPAMSGEAFAAAAAAHPNVDPTGIVPASLKQAALVYFDANKAKLQNTKYITVIDITQHSGKERLFLIDMTTGAVTKTVVAHGTGSDPSNSGTPTKFGNGANSKMTSLGFYKTGELYTSTAKFGKGMRLDGLQATNSNARARGVVMHGASYVAKGRAKQGRSYGCPAVAMGERDGFFAKLKGGSLLLIDRAGAVPADGCDGKADGYYCSSITASSAYSCRGGVRSGATQCEDSSKKCKSGTGGAATTSGGKLTCQ